MQTLTKLDWERIHQFEDGVSDISQELLANFIPLEKQFRSRKIDLFEQLNSHAQKIIGLAYAHFGKVKHIVQRLQHGQWQLTAEDLSSAIGYRTFASYDFFKELEDLAKSLPKSSWEEVVNAITIENVRRQSTPEKKRGVPTRSFWLPLDVRNARNTLLTKQSKRSLGEEESQQESIKRRKQSTPPPLVHKEDSPPPPLIHEDDPPLPSDQDSTQPSLTAVDALTSGKTRHHSELPDNATRVLQPISGNITSQQPPKPLPFWRQPRRKVIRDHLAGLDRPAKNSSNQEVSKQSKSAQHKPRNPEVTNGDRIGLPRNLAVTDDNQTGLPQTPRSRSNSEPIDDGVQPSNDYSPEIEIGRAGCGLEIDDDMSDFGGESFQLPATPEDTPDESDGAAHVDTVVVKSIEHPSAVHDVAPLAQSVTVCRESRYHKATEPPSARRCDQETDLTSAEHDGRSYASFNTDQHGRATVLVSAKHDDQSDAPSSEEQRDWATVPASTKHGDRSHAPPNENRHDQVSVVTHRHQYAQQKVWSLVDDEPLQEISTTQSLSEDHISAMQKRLSNTTWLNDNVISHFLGHLVRPGYRVIYLADRRPNQAWEQWAEGRSFSVKHHTTNIFVPLCEESHWTLLHIDLEKTEWGHYDSMSIVESSEATEFAFAMMRACSLDHTVFRRCNRWQASQQDNSYDCGVHVLINALHILAGFIPSVAYDCTLWRQAFSSALQPLVASEISDHIHSRFAASPHTIAEKDKAELLVLESKAFQTHLKSVELLSQAVENGLRLAAVLASFAQEQIETLQEEDRSLDVETTWLASSIADWEQKRASIPQVLQSSNLITEMKALLKSRQEKKKKLEEKKKKSTTPAGNMAQQLFRYFAEYRTTLGGAREEERQRRTAGIQAILSAC